MKLKNLPKRAYNALFHTHTVAGIVISFALFVIFYAGAFTIFFHEIAQWENPDFRQPVKENINIDQVLQAVDKQYQLNFHELTNVSVASELSPVVSVYGAYNDTDSTTQRMAAYYSPKDAKIYDIKHPKTTLGRTIYQLHFFRQIPVIGLYLAGLVALFFLFATVTGVLIHWKNLFTKFFAFVTEGKLKLIWKNAHTVLGLIGLPFQIMYAVTGAFFGLLTFILLPSVFLLYDGDVEKIFAKVQPQRAIVTEENAPIAQNHLTLNEIKEQFEKDYPKHDVQRFRLRNFGKEDAVATVELDAHSGIASSGEISLKMKDGEILEKYSIYPDKKTYRNSVTDFIIKLHFASFGGLLVRVLYFILSLITCFMIISGILIWRTARDNNRYTYKQKLFHHKVTKIYLAICLSMFPAFAIIFLANKIVPLALDSRATVVNTIFFTSWLALTIIGSFWEKYSVQNRNYLMIGGLLSLLIPLANGIVTGDWLWTAWKTYPAVAMIDAFWLIMGLTSLYLSYFILKVKATSDRPAEEESLSTLQKKNKKDLVLS